jgi:hypothetical protein
MLDARKKGKNLSSLRCWACEAAPTSAKAMDADNRLFIAISPKIRSHRRRWCNYFGTSAFSFSASLMFSLKPPGITMSPGF